MAQKQKSQPIPDREIAATKTAQEEINDNTHGQLMISFPPMAHG
jgi:hypothetical protein